MPLLYKKLQLLKNKVTTQPIKNRYSDKMKNLKRPEQLELDAMSRADLCVLIMQLFDMLEKLDSRLVEVEKNSKNSSKPPSSDGLRKGAAQPRQVGTKPTGGQKGHQGVTREMIKNPDVIEALYPITDVCECGSTPNC
jgi:transposase